MEAAVARLSYCTVPAPISGVVLSVHVTPGQLVSLMAPATLMTMLDDSNRRARIVLLNETPPASVRENRLKSPPKAQPDIS